MFVGKAGGDSDGSKVTGFKITVAVSPSAIATVRVGV